MKPSEEQKQLIELISNEIEGWQNTNDITSMSHWTLIEEFCNYEVDALLDDFQRKRLNNGLDEIMGVIKSMTK